jgi:hypothetical protein
MTFAGKGQKKALHDLESLDGGPAIKGFSA